LALTSRILFCYSLFIILMAMPRIIHSVTVYITGDNAYTICTNVKIEWMCS
jgi:hypothetical protein